MKSLKCLAAFNSPMVSKKILAAIAVSSLFSMSMLAQAEAPVKKGGDQVQHHKQHDGQGPGRMGQERPDFGAKLNLTDAQKAAVKASHEVNKAGMKDLHEKIHTARKAVGDAIEGNADDAMLAKLTSDVATLEAQGELMRAKGRRDFQNLLTPEQKQTLASLKAEKKPDPRWKGKKKGEPKPE